MTDASVETSATEVLTFGCRLNAYESEAIREHAAAGGLENLSLIHI